MVKVQQRVTVTVLEVDLARRRIALSMKSKPVIGSREARAAAKPQPASRPSRPPSRPPAVQERPLSVMAEALRAMMEKRRLQ